MDLDHSAEYQGAHPSPKAHAEWLAGLIVFASVRENNGNYVQTVRHPDNETGGVETYSTVMFPKTPKHARNIGEAVLIEAYVMPWSGNDPTGQIEEVHTLEEAEAQHKAAVTFLAGAPDIRESFDEFAALPLDKQEEQLFLTTMMYGLPPLGPIQNVIDSGVRIELYEVFPEPTRVS
jgi:hypothetical protein